MEGTNVTVSGTTEGATVESGEPLNNPENYTTVWYTWVAPFSGKAGLSGNLKNYSIYTGDQLTNLTPVRLLPHFLAVEGTIYHIQIESVNASGITIGPFSLTMTVYYPLQEVSNDDLVEAASLAGSVFGDTKGILGVSVEEGEPQHRNGAPSKSIGWRWQAPTTATLTINGAPSLTPEVVYEIYTGESLRALNLVAAGTNILKAGVLAGRSYYICAAVAEDAIGDVSFSLIFRPVARACH